MAHPLPLGQKGMGLLAILEGGNVLDSIFLAPLEGGEGGSKVGDSRCGLGPC